MRPEPLRSIASVFALLTLVISASIAHADIFGTATSVSLFPPGGSTGTGTEDDQQRGLYVTAIKDFQICGIGFGLKIAAPGTLTVAVYAANGTEPSVLLASASDFATDTLTSFQSVPINYTLEACKDYDIRVGWGDATEWVYADESLVTLPYDAAGLIRIRDGEWNGDAVAGDRIMNIRIIGESVGPSTVLDLSPIEWQGCGAGPNEQRGIYLTPTKTITVCAIGFDVGGQTAPYLVEANIYEATGTTRGNSIASGSAEITTTSWEVHKIPINAVLLEGHDYNISITVPENGSYSCRSEFDFGLPYFVNQIIEVRDGESQGNANNTILPHLQIHYYEGVGGPSIDLTPSPTDTSTTAMNHGIYVTSLTDLDVYSVGWLSAVPSGAAVTARIYEATGTTRGALITEGTVPGRVFGGSWWHDIPVSARLVSGQDYDIEIVMSTVDEWGYWQKLISTPYSPGGLLQVTSPETNGNAAGTNKVLDLRMNACEGISSSVDRPLVAPSAAVYLSAPTPNPVSGVATIAYQLQEPAPVEIALYDVAGRKVAVILSGTSTDISGIATIDAKGLVSGVYFAKLSTPTASVSRKVLVMK